MSRTSIIGHAGWAVASFARPANTTGYTAGDVVGAALAALEFSYMGPRGGNIKITSAAHMIERATVIASEAAYTLHLYNATPPSAFADNASWDLQAGDRASYLGSVSLGTPLDLVSTVYIGTDGIEKQLKLEGTSLFGYLVTVGAYTPESATVHKITLHSIAG